MMMGALGLAAWLVYGLLSVFGLYALSRLLPSSRTRRRRDRHQPLWREIERQRRIELAKLTHEVERARLEAFDKLALAAVPRASGKSPIQPAPDALTIRRHSPQDRCEECPVWGCAACTAPPEAAQQAPTRTAWLVSRPPGHVKAPDDYRQAYDYWTGFSWDHFR